jgi:hypothetical protein
LICSCFDSRLNKGLGGNAVRALVRLPSALLLVAASLSLSAAPAAAATFTVNTTTEGGDANLGNGECATSAGQCSLRAAIEEANNFGGADIIVLPAGEYHLGAAQLMLSDAAEVLGAGAATTIIDQDTFDRIFLIGSGVTATISGVTIRGGATPTNDGGGIDNQGNLTLVRVAVLDNNAGLSGGGIVNTTGTSSLTIDNSTISGNRASGGKAAASTSEPPGASRSRTARSPTILRPRTVEVSTSVAQRRLRRAQSPETVRTMTYQAAGTAAGRPSAQAEA